MERGPGGEHERDSTCSLETVDSLWLDSVPTQARGWTHCGHARASRVVPLI